ncbi:PepSY-associated TM helix domain-containing protein [Paracidovorax cattleyae]|nr:PepSY-associated TM helix domain-containing protein [Paracidovorax cattleyae]
MSWLHTWSGLVLGWLLFAIFLTGTLSYILDEIDVWMQPGMHQSVPTAATPQLAVDTLKELAPNASSWTISLPTPRQIALGVSWTDPGAEAASSQVGRGRGRNARLIELDASTGEKLTRRETAGGRFLYRFHFELYNMPRNWSRWIVGIATMFMFAAIVSGVITHKKIFVDFFTFRPGKGQRSWLDAHNVTAVLALPFHIMITFSGLLLLMLTIMPWGIQSTYGDVKTYFAESRGGHGAGGAPGGGGARGTRPADTEPQGWVEMAPVGPMIVTAHRRWGGQDVASITVTRPGKSGSTVELREAGGSSLLDRGSSRSMVLDADTGRVLSEKRADAPSAWAATVNALTTPHLGRFAGPALRLLLFVSGLIGAAMVATGMVLWLVKRSPTYKAKTRHAGHRCVEILNVAAISGLLLAVAAYFLASRFIPSGFSERAAWEIRSFFIVWVLSLAHAALRSHKAAWIEQLALAAIAFASLPLVNGWTGGAPLTSSVRNAQWSLVIFEVSMLVLSAACITTVYFLTRRSKKVPTSPKRQTAQNGAELLEVNK